MSFSKIDIKDLKINPFTSISTDWMLISAGDENKFNTMTASWGGLGSLWGEHVVTAYIRPQRYTYSFVENNDCFTLSFFDGNYKKELGVLGSVSGKDEDKVSNVGFHPTFIEGVPTFEEASLVFIVEKMYQDEIKPEFFKDQATDTRWYPEHDYHTFYIGKIKSVYVQK